MAESCACLACFWNDKLGFWGSITDFPNFPRCWMLSDQKKDQELMVRAAPERSWPWTRFCLLLPGCSLVINVHDTHGYSTPGLIVTSSYTVNGCKWQLFVRGLGVWKIQKIPIWYLCGAKFIRAQSSKALSKAAWLKIPNLFCLMLFSSTFLSVMWLHFGILNNWCPCPTGSLVSRGVQYPFMFHNHSANDGIMMVNGTATWNCFFIIWSMILPTIWQAM